MKMDSADRVDAQTKRQGLENTKLQANTSSVSTYALLISCERPYPQLRSEKWMA